MNKLAALSFAFVAILFASFTAPAANFTVTKVADTNDGTCDADCSLREAIAAANAAAGDDTILFSSLFSTAQTIVLSGSEMVVTANGSLTINGPGANLLTLDGNMASRIISLSAAVTATIDGIRFTRGNGVGAVNTGSGGAIQTNGGVLTLSNCIVTGNQTTGTAGGARNSGTGSVLTVVNCVFSNNTAGSSGGAIQNFSTSNLVVINSTFSGNQIGSTGSGGAIQANGMAEFINSTFSGNMAGGTTGGGAISTNGTLFRMTNSTVVGNTSTANGGGIHRPTTNVNGFIRNSIIAGNTGPSPDVSNSTGGLQSQGNNIIGTVGTSTGWIGSDLLNTNPMLGPFADNGGFGFTYLPLAGSPAIDGGQNCVLDLSCSANNPSIPVVIDQRGITRPQGAAVDIGSVEVASMVANVNVGGTRSWPVWRGCPECPRHDHGHNGHATDSANIVVRLLQLRQCCDRTDLHR